MCVDDERVRVELFFLIDLVCAQRYDGGIGLWSPGLSLATFQFSVNLCGIDKRLRENGGVGLGTCILVSLI